MSLPSIAGLPSSSPRTSTSVRSAIFLWRFGTEDTPTRRAKAAGAAVQYAKESAHAHTLAYVRVFSAMTATFDGCSHRAPCTETPATGDFHKLNVDLDALAGLGLFEELHLPWYS